MALSLLLAGLLIVIAAMLLHGVGVGVERLLGLPANRWAMTSAIGLAGLLFLGGIVNLLDLAFGWCLLSIVAIGVLCDIVWWVRGGWERQCHAIVAYGRLNAAMAAMVIVAVVGFVAATQFPAGAYNFHDDFEKYFAFPVRMLATGTLAGNPLDALGVETLGGQSYLQGFVLSLLPIGYINGVDAVLCLTLSLIMAASSAQDRRWPLGAVAALVVVLVDPHYVSVASIYSGVFLALGAVYWAAEAPRERIGPWRHGAVMALIMAETIALKPSYGLFAALFAALIAAGWLAVERRPGITAKWLLAVGLATVVVLAPWLLLYANSFAHALQAGQAASLVPATDSGVDFLSAEALPYGGSFLLYTATVLGGLTLVVLPLTSWRRANAAERQAMIALGAGGVAVAAAYFIIVLVLGRWQSVYSTALRYTLPGVVALAALAMASVMRPVSVGGIRRATSMMGAAAFVGLVLAGFLPSAAVRVAQAVEYRNILGFHWVVGQPDFIAHNRRLLAPDAARPTLAAQASVPPGAAIVAWTESPFLFDFARNPIYEVQPAGLASPWAHVPVARYVIWEYRGYGVRSAADYQDDIDDSGAYERVIAARSLNFVRMLDQAARGGRILYNDGSMVAFELTAPLSDEWRIVTLPQ